MIPPKKLYLYEDILFFYFFSEVKFDRSVLNTNLGELSYYHELITPITIDGVEYLDAEIIGIKISCTDPDRYFIVANSCGSTDSSVWNTYIANKAIIMRKVEDEYDSGWYSNFDKKHLETYTCFSQLGITNTANYTVPDVVEALPIGSTFSTSAFDFYNRDSNFTSQINSSHGIVTITKYNESYVKVEVETNGTNGRKYFYESSAEEIIANTFTYNVLMNQKDTEWKHDVIYEWDGNESTRRTLAYTDMWHSTNTFQAYEKIDIQIVQHGQIVTLSFVTDRNARLSQSQNVPYSFSFNILVDTVFRQYAGYLTFAGRYITNPVIYMRYNGNEHVALNASDIYVIKIIGYHA